ncbi:phage tail assembly chaperone [Limnobaculum parvum]|uniref:Uncharacterized protein n=1 Tax=Limnobaculum parvum TaxID=2172103 RepID=A0A2Y9TWE1_9GAMM|nr:hypothetical protein [Limnobaculum parvum]AWH88023.1 hypothetical protein HYN51_05285 [Limnobaculum parvum]
MQVETFIIGNREFTAGKMNAFDAGRLLLKLKSVVAPGLALMGQGGEVHNSSILELFSGLDEKTHEDILFPILSVSATYSVENKRKIASPADMNFCFTVDNLLDFYLLVWEVLKLNFAPFIEQLASHFGSHTAEVAKV